MIISLADYWSALDRHNWFYQMDDGSRFREGAAAHRELEAIASQSPEHKKMFMDFHEHFFSGPSFGTVKMAKPERPE